jgi:hypothetical protein
VIGLWALGQLAAWQPALRAAKVSPPWRRAASNLPDVRKCPVLATLWSGPASYE